MGLLQHLKRFSKKRPFTIEIVDPHGCHRRLAAPLFAKDVLARNPGCGLFLSADNSAKSPPLKSSALLLPGKVYFLRVIIDTPPSSTHLASVMKIGGRRRVSAPKRSTSDVRDTTRHVTFATSPVYIEPGEYGDGSDNLPRFSGHQAAFASKAFTAEDAEDHSAYQSAFTSMAITTGDAEEHSAEAMKRPMTFKLVLSQKQYEQLLRGKDDCNEMLEAMIDPLLERCKLSRFFSAPHSITRASILA